MLKHLEKIQQGFYNKTRINTEEQLLTVLIVLDINSDISPVQRLPKESKSFFYSLRVFS